MVAAHHVGKMKKIKIGHDRTQLSKSKTFVLFLWLN